MTRKNLEKRVETLEGSTVGTDDEPIRYFIDATGGSVEQRVEYPADMNPSELADEDIDGFNVRINHADP